MVAVQGARHYIYLTGLARDMGAGMLVYVVGSESGVDVNACVAQNDVPGPVVFPGSRAVISRFDVIVRNRIVPYTGRR